MNQLHHESIKFSPSDMYTLGVEVEFQVIDHKSMALKPQAPDLLNLAPSILKPRLSQEFLRSILEIQTGICFSLRDVENDLLQTCSFAEELATEKECLLFASSLHPFSMPSDQVLTENDRYVRIMSELQQVGRDFMAQGLHVHVGLPDGDTAISICNDIQLYLPLLLSLSASSPFFKANDTGFSSFRTKLFEALPLAGLYDNFDSWLDFSNEVDRLVSLGVIGSMRDLWWDVRPSPEFGTVEIRICDLPISFSDLLGIVAFIQALVATLVEKPQKSQKVSRQILLMNKWQAARHGLDGHFIDPGYLLSGRKETRLAVQELLEIMSPMAIRLGSESYLNRIESILVNGNGAMKKRQMFSEISDWQVIISKLQKGFWK